MRGFNPIKTMQKYFVIVIVITIICSLAVCYILNKKQTYSASILIEYTGEKAQKGLNPDDTEIDISEIYSATVIENVIRNMNLDCSVEEIRGSVVVQPVIPLTETKRETAAIELNTEYEFIPTRFLVTYTADSDYSEEYAREVLDSILMHYYNLYSQKYIENVAHPNNSLHISLDNYDYTECVEILRNNINSIATFCMARDPAFYSAKSGYSFVDLQLELEHLRDTALYDLGVYIIDNQLTRDKELLLQREANNIRQYEIKLDDLMDYTKEQELVIKQFADKTLDGQAGMQSLEDAGIITDVENDTKLRESVDTTYDKLTNNYTQLLLEANYYELEIKKAQDIIEAYSKENLEIDANADNIAKEQLEVIISKFNKLYESFTVVVKDYYNVRSAEYLSFNSNVQTVANVNLKLYAIVAVFMFFVLWSCAFIVLDRVKDILIMNKENRSVTTNLNDNN